MKQLELIFPEFGKLPVLSNCTKMLGIPFVPGCPRCEGWKDETGWCWNHQNQAIRAQERREPRVSREEMEQHRGIIESMKRDLLAAAAAGRPMPCLESEDMTPREKLDFRHRVFVAMMETGTVIVTAPTEEPKKARR